MKKIILSLIIISMMMTGCAGNVSDNAALPEISQTENNTANDTKVEEKEEPVIEEVVEEVREELVVTKTVSEDEIFEEFTFSRIPIDVKDLEEIDPECYEDPYFSAALAIMAMCNYKDNPDATIEMLVYLNGTEGLTDYEKEFHRIELDDREFKPFSYLAGATPENYYTPDEPYTVRIYGDKYTWVLEGRVKVFAYTSGADKPRAINVRYDEEVNRWCVYEHGLLGYMKEPGPDEVEETISEENEG